MPQRNTILAVLATLTLTCTMTFAQDEGPGRPRGGGARFSPERLMENDANGDGLLSPDELPDQFSERFFSRVDVDQDGFIDAAELEVFFANRPQVGGPGQGGRGGRGGQGGAGGEGGAGGGARAEVTFGAHMRNLGRAMRRLSRSEFDAADRDADFEAIAAVQASLIGAKRQMGSVKPSTAATEKFGTDMAAYHRAMRIQLIAALSESIKLEMALVDNNPSGAKETIKKMVEIRDAAHTLFQGEEDDEPRKGGDDDDH